MSEALLSALAREPHVIPLPKVPRFAQALRDDDLHLALYLCYELHYRGIPGADDRWEWEPSLLAFRGVLERAFEAALIDALGPPRETTAPEEMDLALRAIADADDAPSLSRRVEALATREQLCEFLVHRSAYQLKEADPHSWALPRLHGGPKAAMVEIQADEYGGGRPDRIHAALFAKTMRALGLDDTYGAYLARLPGVTLATVNLMSMLGLQRRWRGAIIGHLALFEMTSSIPNRRYGSGPRRLGLDGEATDFFDEHVVADAVHENVAAVDLAGGLARQDPALAPSILWGARALVLVEAAWAAHIVNVVGGRAQLAARAPAGRRGARGMSKRHDHALPRRPAPRPRAVHACRPGRRRDRARPQGRRAVPVRALSAQAVLRRHPQGHRLHRAERSGLGGQRGFVVATDLAGGFVVVARDDRGEDAVVAVGRGGDALGYGAPLALDAAERHVGLVMHALRSSLGHGATSARWKSSSAATAAAGSPAGGAQALVGGPQRGDLLVAERRACPQGESLEQDLDDVELAQLEPVERDDAEATVVGDRQVAVPREAFELATRVLERHAEALGDLLRRLAVLAEPTHQHPDIDVHLGRSSHRVAASRNRMPGNQLELTLGPLFVVQAADRFAAGLTGRADRDYVSPPQRREEALRLAGMLLDAPGVLDGDGPWQRALAGGRRTVRLVEAAPW